MRPYTDAQGKTPKKKTRRGEKALNGVKKSLTKAKVNAVKTTRKLQNGSSEEVQDLLNSTANGATPKAKEVAEKVVKTSNAAKQMKKLKSLVKVAENGNSGESPRKSARLRQKAGEKIEAANVSIEEAVEAKEEVDGRQNGGFLQRTISKIWRLPSEGLTGAVPYSDIEENSPQKDKSPPVQENGHAEAKSEAGVGKSCVIS